MLSQTDIEHDGTRIYNNYRLQEKTYLSIHPATDNFKILSLIVAAFLYLRPSPQIAPIDMIIGITAIVTRVIRGEIRHNDHIHPTIYNYINIEI